MARGKGKKGGSGWSSQGSKRSGGKSSSGGSSFGKAVGRQVDRMSKGQDSRKVHDTKGKNNHGRGGGQSSGGQGAR